MDNTPNQANWPNLSNQDNRPKPPPPPPPEITLRTLKSDVDSLKQTGGSSPTPRPFTPPELKTPPISGSIPPINLPVQEKPTAPPAPQPQRPPIGTAQSFPSRTVSPEQFSKNDGLQKPTNAATPLLSAKKSSKTKTIALVIGLLIIGVGAALLGYFIVFPALFPPKTNQPITVNETPITESPVNEQPITQTEPTRAAFIHQSLLTTSDGAIDATLGTINASSIAQVLTQEAQRIASPGAFLEIILKDPIGSVPAPLFLSALFPDITTFANDLENDFTLAMYYDENGAWPVYIFKMKSGENTANLFQAFEASPNLTKLFASAPGTPATFKAGKIGTMDTRYMSYSQKGASLNIGAKGNTFILSTSFNALKNNLSKIK